MVSELVLEPLGKLQGANKPSASWLGRNTCKRVLDLALYLVACVTAGTGLLLAYRLPHGAGNAGRVVFFGCGRHEWGDIHTWLAYFGIFLVVVHLALNWQWLVQRWLRQSTLGVSPPVSSRLLVVIAFLFLPVGE